MCFPQLRTALISLGSVIGFFSGCGTPYGTMGGFSEFQLAPDIYRVSFSPYGYISWDFAYLQEDRTGRAQTMLEAHEALIKTAPENLPKFKDVIQYLEEELHLWK